MTHCGTITFRYLYFDLYLLEVVNFCNVLDSRGRHGGSSEDSSGSSLSQEIHGFQLGPVPFLNGTGMIVWVSV